MSDIYVQYAATESEELKPLRIFAKVPRAKIHEYQQVSDDPTLSDEDIAKKLSVRLAENRLGQLRASWTNVSCLELVPAELQEREPDFEENGMALWTIKN
jgi:hypothetical protein